MNKGAGSLLSVVRCACSTLLNCGVGEGAFSHKTCGWWSGCKEQPGNRAAAPAPQGAFLPEWDQGQDQNRAVKSR
jgi:hypothetical protein